MKVFRVRFEINLSLKLISLSLKLQRQIGICIWFFKEVAHSLECKFHYLICYWHYSSQAKFLCYFKHVASRPVADRLINHWPVPGRASADSLEDFRKLLTLYRLRTIPGRFKFRTKSSGARPMCGNAGRAPSDVTIFSMTLQNCELKGGPKFHRAPCDV